MLELNKQDFRPIATFPLKWRWTDSRWNKLPRETLERIGPLNELKAAKLFGYFKKVCDGFWLTEPTFENIRSIDTSTQSEEEVSRWLVSCNSNLNPAVILSWDEKLAVLTDWKVFCQYWDDFCYPASDDLAVFPLSEEWALLYQHNETFVFGSRSEL